MIILLGIFWSSQDDIIMFNRTAVRKGLSIVMNLTSKSQLVLRTYDWSQAEHNWEVPHGYRSSRLGQGITGKKKGETNPTNTENNLGEVWTTAASTCVFLNPKPSTTATGYHNIPTDINQLQAVGEDEYQKLNYHAELLWQPAVMEDLLMKLSSSTKH